MATEFCTKCKQAHPGRECDFTEGECVETLYQLSEEASTHHGDPGDEDDSKADSD